MLRSIVPADIGNDWERVRAGLLVVKQMTTDDWLPEDVYMSLKNGTSTLYIGEDDAGDYEGFIVLRLVPTFHASRVDIWAAHSATRYPIMRRYWGDIQAIAKQVGAAKIGFSSAREEWQRVASRLGFTPKQISYEFTL